MPDIFIPEELVSALRNAERVGVLTGAGISAESGVPTFRDAQSGLWAQYDPQELATAAAFRRNPRLVWEWYGWRRELIARAEPNPGHLALAEMERHIPHFTLITQNIDALHAVAGSRDLIELHGNIRRNKCFREGQIIPETEAVEAEEGPPTCPRCGAFVRPDVVWFGEALPEKALARAVFATRQADVFLSIGTSTQVYPAAALPLEAVEHGAVTVEVNPQLTPVTKWMDHVLQGPAGEVLPLLVARVWEEER
ncbi:MAG: NAD-dependent deacylase [Candidatus Promineifilaceae bacterium]|nr:NAD-dependent deacylase [Candidatus Promineifilaceae bacterium]